MAKKTEKKWFVRKSYGWGWRPATWQGWGILAAYALAVGIYFVEIDSNSHSASDTFINFIPVVLLLTVGLLVICYKKGESPRWQWGSSKKNKK